MFNHVLNLLWVPFVVSGCYCASSASWHNRTDIGGDYADDGVPEPGGYYRIEELVYCEPSADEDPWMSERKKSCRMHRFAMMESSIKRDLLTGEYRRMFAKDESSKRVPLVIHVAKKGESSTLGPLGKINNKVLSNFSGRFWPATSSREEQYEATLMLPDLKINVKVFVERRVMCAAFLWGMLPAPAWADENSRSYSSWVDSGFNVSIGALAPFEEDGGALVNVSERMDMIHDNFVCRELAKAIRKALTHRIWEKESSHILRSVQE